MFLIVGFLARQILSIVESQIETKRLLSLIDILTNLKRYHLQMNNLKKLIFVNKYWPNDPRVGCKSPSNLVKLIEKDLELEEKLE
jgi:hypothetical protein